MGDVLEAVVLGVVQGLTEFLPISSTGHLILTEELLGIPKGKFGLQFDAAIHLGTLTAVLIYFRVTVLGLITAWLKSLKFRDWKHTSDSKLAWLLLLGTIPAAVAGYLLESTVEDAFREPVLVAAMLIAFSLPMYLAERYGSQRRTMGDINAFDALFVGVAQAVALIPGVSRSGITISAGMFDGLRREQAATFAFLLSAPIIAGAGGKQLLDIARGESSGSSASLGVYAVGLVTAAVVGYAAVAFLIRYLRGNPLNVFIAYRIGLGLLVLGLVAAGVL